MTGTPNRSFFSLQDHPSDKNPIMNETEFHVSPHPRLYVTMSMVAQTTLCMGYLIVELNVPNFNTDCDINNQTECIFFPKHTEFSYVVASSSWILAAALGAFFSSSPMDLYGRRRILLLNACLMILGSLVQVISPTIWIFSLGRFIIGLSVGIGTTVASCYATEISLPHIRGQLGAFLQVPIVIGILLFDALVFPLATSSLWRYLMGMPMIFGMIQLIFCSYMIESPRWLITEKKINQAKESLLFFYPTLDAEKYIKTITDSREIVDVELQGNVISLSQRSPTHENSYVFRSSDISNLPRTIINESTVVETPPKLKDLFHQPLLRPMLISIVLMIVQHFSGINGVFFYSAIIFEKVHIDDIRISNIILAAVDMVSCIIALFMIEKWNRRTILLSSIFGMLLSAIGMSLSLIYDSPFMINLSTALYIFFFAFGLGPMPWLIASEIFHEKYRAQANGIAKLVNWLSSFIISFGFYYLQEAIHSYSFLIFAGILTFALIFTYYYVPETRNKTLEEVDKNMMK